MTYRVYLSCHLDNPFIFHGLEVAYKFSSTVIDFVYVFYHKLNALSFLIDSFPTTQAD